MATKSGGTSASVGTDEEEHRPVAFDRPFGNQSDLLGRRAPLDQLIDRETGHTTYDVVKNMRGSFSAFMWQGVALMFNSSLKSDYDADGSDKDIEAAIKLIEDGQF